MRTINSNKEELEIFLDPKTKEYVGFSGKVQVYDTEMYVNTKTGKGYDEVIKKLNKLVGFLASKYKLKGFSPEDTKQHISMRIIEGTPKFDPRRNVKLSTFIQMRVNRRLINEIRDQSHSSKNATLLKINSYNYLCGCGNSFNLVLSDEENTSDRICEKCNASITSARKVSLGFSEVYLDAYYHPVDPTDGSEDGDFSSFVDNKSNADENGIILDHDISEWIAESDPSVAKLLNLIVMKDYSVSRAAKEIGMSNSSANSKLKKLKDDKKFMEIMGK
jgi:DNA-directed RNA polymerase sigma subunit (sigma70/sigma32)